MARKKQVTTNYNMIVIGIFDTKGESFIDQAMVHNQAVAIRAFTDQVNKNDPQNNLFKWPDDYELWQLGAFDSRSGALLPNKERLIKGSQAKVRETIN